MEFQGARELPMELYECAIYSVRVSKSHGALPTAKTVGPSSSRHSSPLGSYFGRYKRLTADVADGRRGDGTRSHIQLGHVGQPDASAERVCQAKCTYQRFRTGFTSSEPGSTAKPPAAHVERVERRGARSDN